MGRVAAKYGLLTRPVSSPKKTKGKKDDKIRIKTITLPIPEPEPLKAGFYLYIERFYTETKSVKVEFRPSAKPKAKGKPQINRVPEPVIKPVKLKALKPNS